LQFFEQRRAAVEPFYAIQHRVQVHASIGSGGVADQNGRDELTAASAFGQFQAVKTGRVLGGLRRLEQQSQPGDFVFTQAFVEQRLVDIARQHRFEVIGGEIGFEGSIHIQFL
jgi:hypothetical protein